MDRQNPKIGSKSVSRLGHLHEDDLKLINRTRKGLS